MKRIFKKNQIMISALAVMIDVAGYLNYSGKLFGDDAKKVDNEMANQELLDISLEETAEIDSLDSEVDETPGEAVYTTTTVAGMTLTDAKLLKEHEDEIEGTIKLMFQPAEEIFEGSRDMIQNGLLKNPDVDAALMIHVMAGVPIPEGTIIACDGGVSAPAADYFDIQIQGKGCHGAMPELGIDPIHIASHIVIALQELHARELSMSDDTVLTIGSFQAGNANNVIPDIARLTGTLRAFDETVRNRIKLRLTEICTGIAKTFRGRAEVTFTSGCPTLLNDDSLSKDISNYCKELLGKDMAFLQADLRNQPKSEKTAKATGSEDFSYISHEIPTVMVALSAGNSENGFLYPLHHPKVTFDETVLSYGASIYTYTAMRWLEENFETLYY